MPEQVQHPVTPPAPVNDSSTTRSKRHRTITLRLPVFIFMIVSLFITSISGFIGGIAVSSDNIIQAQARAATAEEDKKKVIDYYSSLIEKQATDDKETESDKSDNKSQPTTSNGVGTSLTNGGITLTLQSIDEPVSVAQNREGNQPDLTPEGGTKFFSATFQVKNDTISPIDITCSYPIDIRAVNDKSQMYTPIDGLYKIPGNPECNADLQPGLTTNVTYVFNMPVDTDIRGIAWRDVTDFNVDNDYSVFKLK